jgi:hypothetical protein
MSKHHTVHLHKWENGVLKFTEHVFVTKFDAFHFAKNNKADHVKVLDGYGSVIHSETKESVTTNTYA